MSGVDEINRAYERMAVIDVLDTSESGTQVCCPVHLFARSCCLTRLAVLLYG